MAADYRDAPPDGPGSSYDLPKNHGARMPAWLTPAVQETYPSQPKRTRGTTSQRGKTRSILDWLGQEDWNNAGKNLVPIRRPPIGAQNDTQIGPFGPISTSNPAKGQDVAPENDAGQHDHTKSTQRSRATATEHHRTNFAPFADFSTPFPPRWTPSGKTGGRKPVGKMQERSDTRSMDFDAVHDPSDPAKKDVIFKLSIPIEEDFQPDLGEFCRLRRLGRFGDADKHFQQCLKHLTGVPYVLVQYCEMLLASGSYNSFRTVSYRYKYPSLVSEESVKDPCLDMLEGNFWLLDLLAKVPQPYFDGDIFEAIKRILGKLETESAMGSTEVQILVLCLTILGHLEDCLGDSVTQRVKEHYRKVFDWNKLYHRLLAENRIWDLRDLLVAGGSLFGSQFFSQCLNASTFPKALDQLYEDWIQPEYDESTALALLDLFTSILIDSPSSLQDDPKPRLLLEYSESLVESIQTHDPSNMKSRPFIQWIIAKSISEMGDIPERPDGLRLRDFSGTVIRPGRGIHLPVYIPAKPWDNPHWDMFSVRSSPQQRQSLHVALQAARYIGDYRLQAMCLKLLILHTQEPKVLMESLQSLQWEQGDNEGFLETCLSKYLAVSGENGTTREDLISDFKKIDNILPGNLTQILPVVYNSNSFCEPKASLLWARDVVKALLTDHAADEDEGNRFLQVNINFWNGRLTEYGSRLPHYLINHIRKEFRAEIPPQIKGPLPPSPEETQAPRGPSAIPEEPDLTNPFNNPQIPQTAPFEIPTTMADPATEATYYGNQSRAHPPFYSNHSFDPFDPFYPNVAHPAYYQPNPFAPPPPPTEYDLPHSTTGHEASRLPADYIPPRYPRYPGYSSRRDMNDHGSEVEYIPKAPKYFGKENLVSAALPRKKKKDLQQKKKKKPGNHDRHRLNHRTPAKLLAPQHKSRRSSSYVVNESFDSYDEEFTDSDTGSLDWDDSASPHRGRSGFYGHQLPVKKPEAPAFSDSEDLGYRRGLGDSDDGVRNQENDASNTSHHHNTRIMSPTIDVSRVGKQQNLKISDLSHENDVHIVMTDKADRTKSKVYTVKNGIVTKRIFIDKHKNQESTPGAALDGIPIPDNRPRTKSQSSLQTVRPLPASISRPPPVFVHSAVPPGPSSTIHEEDEGGATDDKSSTMSVRVQKANKYMDRKTGEWLKDQIHGDNTDASSSKRPRPSIFQPRPVRPAAPGSLAKAISTDDDTGEDDDNNSSLNLHENYSSESDVAIGPSDSASMSHNDTTEAEESSAPDTKGKGKNPDIGRRRHHRHSRSQHGGQSQHGYEQDRTRSSSERDRLVDRLSSSRIVREEPAATAAASTSRNLGTAPPDRRSRVVEREVLDGEHPELDDSLFRDVDRRPLLSHQRLRMSPRGNGLLSEPPALNYEEIRAREKQRDNKTTESKKAAVEEVTVEEVD